MNSENNVVATRKKQFRNLALVVLGLVTILAFIFLVVRGGRTQTAQDPKAQQATFVSAVPHVDAGSFLIEKTENRLAVAERAAEELKRQVEVLNQEKQKQEQDAPKEQERIALLTKRIEELEKKLTTEAKGAGGEIFPGGAGPQVLMQGIRDDALNLVQTSEGIKIPAKNPRDYVPAGTFVKAVALGGADASAAVNAQSNPMPMLFRLIEDGTMPNNEKSHLKGCLATAAVVGDISSERGMVRLETLSCIEPDTKRIIDLNVEGTVFGPEGKSGIRGIPMWREGALLQRAFAAGALSGMASGLSQSTIKTAISPLGSVQSVSSDVKDILTRGGASGIGNAMEKLADYNIKRAEQYHPVLQLSAGTVVNIVFLKGFYLREKQEAGFLNAQTQAANTPTLTSQDTGTNNMGNSSNLPLTPSQVERLKEHEAELKG